MLAKNKLKNRDKIDILEKYLGDFACYFSWDSKGYVITSKLGLKPWTIKVELQNYPSNEAIIVGTFHYNLGYQSQQWIFAEVFLSDPKGIEFFRKKIESAIFTAENPNVDY